MCGMCETVHICVDGLGLSHFEVWGLAGARCPCNLPPPQNAPPLPPPKQRCEHFTLIYKSPPQGNPLHT